MARTAAWMGRGEVAGRRGLVGEPAGGAGALVGERSGGRPAARGGGVACVGLRQGALTGDTTGALAALTGETAGAVADDTGRSSTSVGSGGICCSASPNRMPLAVAPASGADPTEDGVRSAEGVVLGVSTMTSPPSLRMSAMGMTSGSDSPAALEVPGCSGELGGLTGEIDGVTRAANGVGSGITPSRPLPSTDRCSSNTPSASRNASASAAACDMARLRATAA